MDESTGALHLYADSGKNYTSYRYLSCYNLQLRKEKVIFFHHVPNADNALLIVTEKQAMYVKWWFVAHQVHNFSKQTRANVDDESTTYVCATSTHDNEYLIIADSAGFVNVWSTYNGYQPVASYRSRVTSLDSYWVREEGYHIVRISTAFRYIYIFFLIYL